MDDSDIVQKTKKYELLLAHARDLNEQLVNVTDKIEKAKRILLKEFEKRTGKAESSLIIIGDELYRVDYYKKEIYRRTVTKIKHTHE